MNITDLDGLNGIELEWRGREGLFYICLTDHIPHLLRILNENPDREFMRDYIRTRVICAVQGQIRGRQAFRLMGKQTRED